MGEVVRVDDLFRRVSAHRVAAHGALERFGGPVAPAEVDDLVASAWAVLDGDIVAAVRRRQAARCCETTR